MQDIQLATELVIGILALQGAFAEHQEILQKFSGKRKLEVIQVRTPEELKRCDALIIPGGESTTIALLAKLSGLIEPLRGFIKTKPVWGTCAGAILLSQAVSNPKKGGQELLGGVSVKITRNGWGSQVESFEAPLEVEGLRDAHMPFTGVFIRAPVVMELVQMAREPPIRVISRLPDSLLPNATSNEGLTEASTPFDNVHPELTDDCRFHEYFVQECVLPSLAL
ncbi:PdxT/SNO family [Multifurca ochricompacta]|uniref:glutaminase n=1 Tax=Multifurca ochricompacta TaxID=376703 RepID=A0AAD4M4Z0_9AGAM|nr:PdxT/SNO family [Multifurca ochricompacta]